MFTILRILCPQHNYFLPFHHPSSKRRKIDMRKTMLVFAAQELYSVCHKANRIKAHYSQLKPHHLVTECARLNCLVKNIMKSGSKRW